MTEGNRTACETLPLPGHPQLRCGPLNEHLAESLIERTLDPSDIRLREMTRDLSRFSSSHDLSCWRPGHDLLCLQDAAESLLGVVWVVEKPMPERDDYFDPELIAARGPGVTWAIRTYGVARGHGLARSFAEHSLERLMRDRTDRSLWYETKAANWAARRLTLSLGFSEASGDGGGRVVGVRFDNG